MAHYVLTSRPERIRIVQTDASPSSASVYDADTEELFPYVFGVEINMHRRDATRVTLIVSKYEPPMPTINVDPNGPDRFAESEQGVVVERWVYSATRVELEVSL